MDVFNIATINYENRFGNDWENKEEIDTFINSLPTNANVLDLGCGTGYLTNYLLDKGLNPIGIDFSNEMLTIAKEKYPKINAEKMEISNIDKKYNESTFDGILASYSLFFIPKVEMPNVLKSISKVLKSNGKMLCKKEMVNNLLMNY